MKIQKVCLPFALLITTTAFAGTYVYAVGVEDIRLSDGDGSSGRVEVYISDRWLSICDKGWGYIEATIVCRQLQRGLFGVPVYDSNYGEGHFFTTGRIKCNGSEESLKGCDSAGLDGQRTTLCAKTKTVGVQCNPGIRLTRGSGSRDGIVQLYSEKEKFEIKERDLLEGSAVVTYICLQSGLGLHGFLMYDPDDEDWETQPEVESSGQGSFLVDEQDIKNEEFPQISCIGRRFREEIAETNQGSPTSPGSTVFHIIVVLIILVYGVVMTIMFVQRIRSRGTFESKGGTGQLLSGELGAPGQDTQYEQYRRSAKTDVAKTDAQHLETKPRYVANPVEPTEDDTYEAPDMLSSRL